MTARRPSMWQRWRDEDQGAVSAYLVVIMVALVAVSGLVFDVGRALAAKSRATSTAQYAARAGADALTGATGRDGVVALDPDAATAAARAVIDSAGAAGEVQIRGLAVTVTVTATRPAAILSIVGITELSGTSQMTAYAVVREE